MPDERVLAGVFAVVLLGATVAVPAVVSARPAFEIPVYEPTSDTGTLVSPGSEAWSEAPPVTVPLSSAGSGLPNADDTTVERVSVQAARTDSRLYLRLTWADATRDTSTDRVRAFADSVAVQFPVNASERPPIAMGGSRNMVNVWYWTADNRTEELLAGGPGSTTAFPNSTVTVNRTYADGRWEVVFSRPLDTGTENRTTVPENADLDVAVAVWNGSNMERSGQKAASDWYYLALGPGPQGPPYETILWVVAGIGIVITTLVTVEGVRRTRGEDS